MAKVNAPVSESTVTFAPSTTGLLKVMVPSAEVTFAPSVMVSVPGVAVKLMLPPVDEITPVVEILPVLLTVTVPVLPLSAIPLIVNGAAVLVNAIPPLVLLVALNVLTVLASFRVVPVAEDVVKVAPLMVPAVWLMSPVVPVKEILPVVAILLARLTLEPAARVTTPAPVLTPLTVPELSVRLATVRLSPVVSSIVSVPLMLAATFVNTFACVRSAEVAPRITNPAPSVARLSGLLAACVMVPAVSSVNTPLCAKFAAGVKAPRLMLPAVPLPIKTLVP